MADFAMGASWGVLLCNIIVFLVVYTGHQNPEQLKTPTVTLILASTHRVVLRWNCAKVIANIDDLAISIWAPKVIDELSQIDDI